MAYFDNASTTYPKPYCVYDFMDSFYRSSGANAGRGNYKLAQSAGALIGDTRKKIQELLHCQAKQVVFEPTATIALNIIIQGIIEKGAVNIYISPFEHNAVTRTLHHFEEQEKIKITQLTVSKGMVYDLEKIRYQFDTVKPDFVIVSHASNVFGLIAPVEDIFALAKKYEAITLVDMAQTAGLVDLNVGLKGDNTVFDIAIKDTSGNTSYVKKSQCEAEVKSILPKELSRYFFFDGERIEKMSKDISTGKKATDFAEAVKGLLGLNAMISAIGHFNPRSSLSVIGSYEKSFDSKSNTKIQEYTAKIDKCNARLAEIDAALEELDTQKAAAETRKSEKVIELKQYSEGKKLQKEKEDLQKQIENTTRMRATVYKTMCKDFNASMSPFFSISLIKRALEVLSRHDYSGKDIPFIRDKTIEYLLKQKVCLCGTHLDEGSVPYEKVKSLLDVIPPKSLSTYVTDFKKESKRRAGALQDLVEQMQENLATASQQSDDIMDKTDELHKIEAKLSGKDVSEKVRAINNEIQICVKTINKCNNDRDKLNIERGGLEKERERADTERQNLTLLDEKNRKTQMYLTYARKIYEELENVYRTSEEEIRNRLQDTINDIFKQIYEGGLSLTIDSKYHITVQANDYEGDVETSTAQSISVIFAFITGIIKMARENRNASDDDAKLLSSEPYPLVMDAPLSAFDKRRIKTVCEALPETAEQVIIFIKDTDGELAEDYMGNRIGSRHQFDKKNEFETNLV